MEATLGVVRGKASKGKSPLNLPTVIGRSREADLTIAHSTVSRKHCELFEEGGKLMIRELGSLNGTFVGKKQVKQAELRPNAEFSIGPLTFRVQYQYEGAAAREEPGFGSDETGELEELPDFTLLDDAAGTAPDSPLDLAEIEGVDDGEPVRGRTNGTAGGDSDVLDFLLDTEPAPGKAGKDKGTSDDELDQFFKQLD